MKNAVFCDQHIRKVMEAEAQKQGLKIDKSRLAELRPHSICCHHAYYHRCADGFRYRAVCGYGNG